MIQTQEEIRDEQLLAVARQMMNAARTAPKGCGIDNLAISMVTGDDIVTLSNRLKELAVSLDRAFFARDGENLLRASAVVLIGTRNVPLGLNCGLCGFDTCAAKRAGAPQAPCAFNMHDLGIAIGSATSVAADSRVDNRVMYSVGVATQSLGWMDDCHAIFAIPLSANGKNPFFDRKPL